MIVTVAKTHSVDISNAIPFKSWLVKKHGFSVRSASDTASRLRRVARLGASPNADGQSLKRALQKVETRKLSPTVKSQLKRAVDLYQEFHLKT